METIIKDLNERVAKAVSVYWLTRENQAIKQEFRGASYAKRYELFCRKLIRERHYNGTKFLGKPYEPNAIIKNDIEFLLMQRKPGGYRRPTQEQRRLSMIGKNDFNEWFRQFWSITDASTKNHPAPFPFEFAYRLVRMFSFWGDTVIDPFCGTGTTMLAAMKCGRNSIGVEIDEEYCSMALHRLRTEGRDLFPEVEIEFSKMCNNRGNLVVQEEPVVYRGKDRKKTVKRKRTECE